MGPEAGITETLQRKDAKLDDGRQEEASVSLHVGLGRMESPVSQIHEHSLLGKSRSLLLPDSCRPAPKHWLSSKQLFPQSCLPRHSGRSSPEHRLNASSLLQALWSYLLTGQCTLMEVLVTGECLGSKYEKIQRLG